MIGGAELEQNLALVRARVAAACRSTGRSESSVRLVAVSKLHPPSLVRLAFELGHRDFGENYAQHLRDKAQALAGCEGIRWHMIGPVQPKNAKYVARAAACFHALDSPEVGTELSRRRSGAPLPCLIEVNVAGEATKVGVMPAQLRGLVAHVRALPGLALVGLTAMPPLVQRAEDNRAHFASLAALAREHGVAELSMGTTSDFEVAIEEGATLVRVGTAIFGERDSSAEA